MTQFLRGTTAAVLALALGLATLAGCESKSTATSKSGDKMGGKMDDKMGEGKMGDSKMGGTAMTGK